MRVIRVMAARISMPNHAQQLIFWSVALIYSSSLVIRCASFDHQKDEQLEADNPFSEAQKESEYGRGPTTQYFSGAGQARGQESASTRISSSNDDKHTGQQKMGPSTSTWHYKKSQDTDSQSYESDGGVVADPNEISLARSLWNRLFGQYAIQPTMTVQQQDEQQDDTDNLDLYNRQQELLGGGSGDSDILADRQQISDEYDQTGTKSNNLWRPPIEAKVDTIYGGVREYPTREPQNLLLKSGFQINSDAHDKYSQQNLDSNNNNNNNNGGHASQDVVSNGDEATMSHLEGYSRKYRLPADYDFSTNDRAQQQQQPGGVNRRPTANLASSNDLFFIVMVGAFCGMAVTVVIAAGLFAFRVQQGRKVSAESDYPTYGVVGPSIQNKGASLYNNGAGGAGGISSVGSASKSSGSMKSLADVLSPVENNKNSLATGNNSGDNNSGNSNNNQRQYQSNQNAARMYHYQHQKQQMLSTDRVSSTRHASASDLDSDEENDEGTYTVYECPGLASTHEMEVKNPLFQDDPTPVGSPTVTK